jgi:hypothetical protein
MEMQTCDGPNAGFDTELRTLIICYNLPYDFSELYRAYGAAPPVGPQRNASASGSKKRSK